MNYSVIFTEISFFSETSILLQIIQIIHMTTWIIPESDRQGGGQSVRSGSKVVYTIHYETPTDKIETCTAQESPRGPSGPPPPIFEKQEEVRSQPGSPKVANRVIG